MMYTEANISLKEFCESLREHAMEIRKIKK